MFQFPGFPTQHYGFMLRFTALHREGFPIRKSADIMLICSSPQLIAACHVLHRLLMPRHSPYALVRLNFLYNVSHYTMVLFELSEFLWTLRSGLLTLFRMKRLLFAFCTCFWVALFRVRFPPCGEIVFPFSFGKTKLSLRLFVLFCSFLLKSFFYSIVKDHVPPRSVRFPLTFHRAMSVGFCSLPRVLAAGTAGLKPCRRQCLSNSP